MTMPKIRNVLILASESVNWKIAGLRQLDRIALAFGEYARRHRPSQPLLCALAWDPAIPLRDRWVPHDSRFVAFRIRSEDADVHRGTAIYDLAISTNMLLTRSAIDELIDRSRNPATTATEKWDEARMAAERAASDAHRVVRILQTEGDLPAAERWFLQSMTKPQDGLVSRYLNRPISRQVTRLLLRTRMSPTAWTVAITPIAAIGCFFLARGDRAGFMVGTLLYQAYSVLDGCDGEIARAKYLESAMGAGLDKWCDVLAGIAFVFSLGFGLTRADSASHSMIEAVVVAGLIAANELALAKGERVVQNDGPETLGSLYQRHRQMVLASGLNRLGEHVVERIFQLTKRDVATLFFVFLAAAGAAPWILHALGLAALGSGLLACWALFRRHSGARGSLPASAQ